MDGYPEILVTSEQVAKDVFAGADSSGLGITMLRAQLLAAKLNAILFPGFDDAYLPDGQQVGAVMLAGDLILDDVAHGISHSKPEITALKDLLDAANNNSHDQVLGTCPPDGPGGATPTPNPPVPCQDEGQSREYWRTHTGLDSAPRDPAYDSLPIFFGLGANDGAPEAVVSLEEDARNTLNDAVSSGPGFALLRAQLLAANLNSVKFSGFESTALDTGEVVGEVMSDAERILNDEANGVPQSSSEIIIAADLLSKANHDDEDDDECDDKDLPSRPGDYDGDGYSDEAEGLHIGTNAADPCGANGWPSDLFPGGYQPNTLNTQDIASFLAPVRRLDTSPGDANFDARWDLVPGSTFGKAINIQDIAALISGPTGSPPMFNGTKAFGHACPAVIDSDSDGIADGADNCPFRVNANQANWDADNLGDVCDDGDLDGFLDFAELHVGTDPAQRCGFAGWPADLYDSAQQPDRLDIQDIAAYLAPVRRLQTSPGDPPYNARWDIYPGNGGFGKHINTADLAAIITLRPGMFGGEQRAFNGPECQP